MENSTFSVAAMGSNSALEVGGLTKVFVALCRLNDLNDCHALDLQTMQWMDLTNKVDAEASQLTANL